MRTHPSSSRSWASAAGALLAVAATGAAGGASTAQAAAPALAGTQQLAVLHTAHEHFRTAGGHRRASGRIAATRPITGARTVLPVLGSTTTPDGVHWLKVLVPGRPNSRRAWIRRRGTTATLTDLRVVVRTGSRRVTVLRAGRRLRSFTAIVGKPSTPTPRGHFFVEESVRMRPGSAGAPFALALSARSDVLQEFAGGPGQIAIHGTGNIGGVMGTAASHGCVRLADRAIRWMAAHVGAGTPVTITS